MSARQVELERVVDAPPQRVYRMWSDADTMASWLCYEVQGSLLPGARSVLVFPRQRLEIEVTEAEPNERFRFRWQHEEGAPMSTEVSVTLRPRGFGTVVTLTDGPYETDDPVTLDAWGRAIEIWTLALAQLRAQVDYSVDLRVRR